MTVTTIQWVALGLCAAGAAVRIPGARRGHGRTIFVALVLLTLAVGLSIAPIYEAVDGLLGAVNIANLLLRLTLYTVFVLLGIRVAAAFDSPLARRLIVGPVGVAILAVTVAATLYFFVASELPGSSTGLSAFDDQDAVQQYAAVGRLYPGYVAACLVIPAVASVFDRAARPIHRVACAFLGGGFSLVVVFVLLRLTALELMAWNIVLPFSAILFTVVGLCLIWLSHTLGKRRHARANRLA
ncbi:hypothetical protein [Arthrobacter agilis]|jgi:hypothetical protein|uniref:hypothetical protein n=1 Tax=Arthrobacter agilis TaxID=37921 RepID=UPI00278B90C5|nr:hypothetical protein [Arthrobacter agilis]MDQ0736789.1 hypothetical protein [Arthrobacter agilis]